MSRPGGKASKGIMDIWVGKHSVRRKGERTTVLLFYHTFHDYQECARPVKSWDLQRASQELRC